eukprot:8660346-Pyramimonas_sp.AAC.1
MWDVGGKQPRGRGLGDGRRGQPMLREKGTRTERHLAAGARRMLGARVAAPDMHPAPLARCSYRSAPFCEDVSGETSTYRTTPSVWLSVILNALDVSRGAITHRQAPSERGGVQVGCVVAPRPRSQKGKGR